MAKDPIFDRQWANIVVQQSGAIVQITMNRPAALNGLSFDLIQELSDFAHLARRRSDIQVVVLTGGDSVFSEGGQVSTIKERINVSTALKRRETVIQGADMVSAWENIEAVTIAAIEGRCRGGGCALALACDFRVIAEGSEMFLPEVPLGLNMGWGTIPRLNALIGPARTKRYVIFGEAPDPALCVEWGLADELAPRGGAIAAAHGWAQRICGLPPVPVRMAKGAVNAIANALNSTTTHMEREQYLLTAPSEDFQEGISALTEKRAQSSRETEAKQARTASRLLAQAL